MSGDGYAVAGDGADRVVVTGPGGARTRVHREDADPEHRFVEVRLAAAWFGNLPAPSCAPDGHGFLVTVSGCTAEQAERVVNERLAPDEDYGFPYELGWEAADGG